MTASLGFVEDLLLLLLAGGADLDLVNLVAGGDITLSEECNIAGTADGFMWEVKHCAA